MSTNESLVREIQAGDIEKMAVLWEQVERLVYWKASRVMAAVSESGFSGGVELDDLYQSGYFALVAAVKTYKPGSCAFTTCFMNHLRTEFAEATGYRTQRRIHDPLRLAVSLDKPVGEDEETPLSELIPDPAAEAAITAVADTEMRNQCSEAVRQAMAGLSDLETAIIDYRYFRGLVITKTATELGITEKEARKLESNALRYLRHPDRARKLREFWG